MKIKNLIKNPKNIFNLNNMPIVLGLIVLINYFPLFLNNINVKTSNAVSVKQMTIAFGIELILIFLYLIKKIKFNKKVIINFAILFLTTIVMLIVQFFNYKNGIFQKMDLANIFCIGINIFILYIMFLNINIEENNIYKFFVFIIGIGILACIVNIVLYRQEMLKLLGIGSSSKFYSIKSFFAQRNQFAFFLYTSIFSTIFLFIKTDKRKYKILLGIIFILFGINLILTASRTGILCTLAFLGLFFLFTDCIKIKTKIAIIIGVLLLGCILIGIIYNCYPDLWKKALNTIQNIFIRGSSIKTFTGRSEFWNLAIGILFVSPISALFGIGRFVGINLLHSSGFNFTQFHSFYIEALVAGGIMELIYLLSIYVFVMIGIIKSQIEKKYKILYICLYLTYGLYCCFESLGRFSIGCVDTMCLIFMITVPLVHSNSIKKLDNEKIDDTNKKSEEENSKENVS